MYATSHAGVAVAAAAVLHLSNPFAAFLVGWGSHYLGDAVPHGDSVPPSSSTEDRLSWQARSVDTAALDGCLLIMLWAWRIRRFGHSWPFTASVIGSITPDVLQIFSHILVPTGGRGFLSAIHGACHNPFGIVLPFWVGLGCQVVLAGLLWAWHLKRDRFRPPATFRRP